MKNQIQTVQNHYNQLVDLLPQLEKNVAQWKEAAEVFKLLETFYFSEQWLELHQKTAQFAVDSKGHYSVLSEDAIYDLFEQLWRLEKTLSGILASFKDKNVDG